MTSYMNIVKKTTRDLVPKAITHYIIKQLTSYISNDMISQMMGIPVDDYVSFSFFFICKINEMRLFIKTMLCLIRITNIFSYTNSKWKNRLFFLICSIFLNFFYSPSFSNWMQKMNTSMRQLQKCLQHAKKHLTPSVCILDFCERKKKILD